MAANPQRLNEERWPRKGRAMTQEEYHELERLSPDSKYEYIDGMALSLRVAVNILTNL